MPQITYFNRSACSNAGENVFGTEFRPKDTSSFGRADWQSWLMNHACWLAVLLYMTTTPPIRNSGLHSDLGGHGCDAWGRRPNKAEYLRTLRTLTSQIPGRIAHQRFFMRSGLKR